MMLTEKINSIWKKLSLRKKMTLLIFAIIIIAGISTGLIMTIINITLNEFQKVTQDNMICYELQNVLEEEKTTFKLYMRERSEENKEAFETACRKSENCILNLPFDYTIIGEERYARTWNIKNGYEGYKEYRDTIVEWTEENPAYIEKLYNIFEMQEELANYALRLVQVTLEQGNDSYTERVNLLETMRVYAVGIVGVMLLIFSVIFRIFSIQLVNPLIAMAEESRRITVYDFHGPELYVKNEDELGELVRAFNKMKKATGDYISILEEKNKITELLHKEEMENLEKEKILEMARLDLLKSQINPHFLFNTLNMISCMAKMEKASVTDKMIVSLGNLFRYNLRTTEQIVYLEQELEALKDYIYIQQMRFDNRIQYQQMILADEKKSKIPSFTLQPLVENAYIHGLASKEESGMITLRIWEEEENLIITIADNGKGIEEKRLEEINQKIQCIENSGHGIGLGNICRRIHMMYKSGEFKIYSKKGYGTVIKMKIPQHTEKGEVKNV